MLILIIVFTFVFCFLCADSGFDDNAGYVFGVSAFFTFVAGIFVVLFSITCPGEKVLAEELPLCAFEEQENSLIENPDGENYLCYLAGNSGKYVFAIEEDSDAKFYTLTNSLSANISKYKSAEAPVIRVYKYKRSVLGELCLFNLAGTRYELWLPDDTDSKISTYSTLKNETLSFEAR